MDGKINAQKENTMINIVELNNMKIKCLVLIWISQLPLSIPLLVDYFLPGTLTHGHIIPCVVGNYLGLGGWAITTRICREQIHVGEVLVGINFLILEWWEWDLEGCLSSRFILLGCFNSQFIKRWWKWGFELMFGSECWSSCNC